MCLRTADNPVVVSLIGFGREGKQEERRGEEEEIRRRK